jgi:IS5 family transposase
LQEVWVYPLKMLQIFLTLEKQMRPREMKRSPIDDMFRKRLDNIIDMRHELVKLSEIIDWSCLSEEFGSLYSGTTGRVGKPIRLMAGILLLQHTYKLSDDEVVKRWSENPYWQYFCGFEYFQHDFPIDPTSLIKWRKRIGKEGCEKILSLTIQAGIQTNVITKRDIKRVIVDTTVQEKNIAHPTDSALYLNALEKLAGLSKKLGIKLRQPYTRKAKTLSFQISRYAHAGQFKRMKKSLKTLKGYLGRVFRDVERKASAADLKREDLAQLLSLIEKLLNQTRTSSDKIYSLHAPEVECIGKGKARKRYEFGNKVSVAIPLKTPFVVGIDSLQGNPYDGHTLIDSLQQILKLTGIKVDQAFVDQGYKGHSVQDTEIFFSRQKRGVTKTLKKHIRRRQAIEPIIGHLKEDGKLGRNYLKGIKGNEINALLSGAGFNIRTILNKINLIFRKLFQLLVPTLNPHTPLRLSTHS